MLSMDIFMHDSPDDQCGMIASGLSAFFTMLAREQIRKMQISHPDSNIK